VARKALIVQGGWDGHAPVQIAQIFKDILTEEKFEVEISDTLDAFLQGDKLMQLSLILPMWTMGKITGEQCKHVTNAVQAGVGIAGIHGGMCDSFRDNTEWQFMTGGQWVAHPGNANVTYKVIMGPEKSSITEGIKDFDVTSEQYYMHVDPAVKVLAYTVFPTADGPHVPNGEVKMPVVWTKMWGKGRVFYSSLGHSPDVAQAEPHRTILKRGFLWAAR
jgi:type 1 glutamine amidotransferase